VQLGALAAKRGDVKRMCAAILSVENDAGRPESFFEQLIRQFLDLGVQIRTEGTLIRDGIRCEAHGDLASLYAAGGCRAELAGAVEAVCALTEGVRQPRLTLDFELLYSKTILIDRDVRCVMRSGMEASETFRLSGVDPHPQGRYWASMTLCPQLGLSELDLGLERLAETSARPLGVGYDAEEVPDIARCLAAMGLIDPVCLTVPVIGTEREVQEALAAARAAVRSDAMRISYLPAGAPDLDLPERPSEERVWLRLVAPSRFAQLFEHEPNAVLAPGQAGSMFSLGGFKVGYAPVIACDAGAKGLTCGLGRALQFIREHPPLRGTTRPQQEVATRSGTDLSDSTEPWPASLQSLIDTATELGARTAHDLATATGPHFEERDWHDQASLFAACQIAEAARRGFILPFPKWRRALLNYGLTAFYTCARPGTTGDQLQGALRKATLASMYMTLIALGDCAVFDSKLPGDDAETWLPRLRASAAFLAVNAGGEPGEAPDVGGRDMLERVSSGWRNFLAPVGQAHPEARLRFQRGLRRIYEASLAEYTPEVTECAEVDAWARGGGRRAAAVTALEHVASELPEQLAEHLRTLVRSGETHPDRVATLQSEIRLWIYLTAVAPTIGASEFFRAILLAWPAEEVTIPKLQALEDALVPLDMMLRVQNDCADLFRYSSGDRDAWKENSGTILIPKGLSQRNRARARIDAKMTCTRVMAVLRERFCLALRRVAEVWPEAGEILSRGAHLGARMYIVSHPEKLTTAQMASLANELQSLPKAGA